MKKIYNVNKIKESTFLGVSHPSKAYKLYNPNTKKIVISHNVVFDEEKFWAWKNDGVGQQIPANFDEENEDERQQLVENEQQSLTTCSHSRR